MLSKVRLERIFTWGQIMLNNKDYRFTKIDADTLNDIAKELKLLAHQVYEKSKAVDKKGLTKYVKVL